MRGFFSGLDHHHHIALGVGLVQRRAAGIELVAQNQDQVACFHGAWVPARRQASLQ
jgi:hypothetical protein